MSTSYTITASQVIDAALRALGVLRSGDSASNDSQLLADCLQALNLLIKNFQNYGLEQWITKTHTISNMTSYKASYTFSNTGDITTTGIPERIIQAYVTPTANIDVECAVISMDEYWGLANKQAEGQPNQVAYYFQNTSGTAYVWPVPNTNTYSLTLIYQKPYNDMVAGDLPDVPQRWFNALKWNLALQLAPEFGKQVSKELLYLAQSSIDNAVAAGYETASVYFNPDRRK